MTPKQPIRNKILQSSTVKKPIEKLNWNSKKNSVNVREGRNGRQNKKQMKQTEENNKMVDLNPTTPIIL